jgi:uncharacterized protein YggE
MGRRISAVSPLVFALAAALAASAQAPAAADPPVPASRVLTMQGEGTVGAAPDMAEVSAGVTTMAQTAAAALAANTARMKKMFAAIAKLGVPEKNVQTVAFSIFPQYGDSADNAPRRLIGYRVNNEVLLRLDDPERLGAALDALVAAGANQVDRVGYSIKDAAPLLSRARAAAVADARAKAQTYAMAAGVSLGPILSIRETGGPSPMPVPRMAPMALNGMPPPMAGGEEKVSASVSITWEIH